MYLYYSNQYGQNRHFLVHVQVQNVHAPNKMPVLPFTVRQLATVCSCILHAGDTQLLQAATPTAIANHLEQCS